MRVVVTGAASGIGRAIAQQADRTGLLGAEPRFLLVDRDAVGLKEAAVPYGDRAALLAADVADDDIGARIVAAAAAHMGGIDAVALNAGIIAGGSLVDTTPESYDHLFAINTRANWMILRAVHAELRKSRGALVCTASISGHQPTPALSAYSASKAALLMLVRQLSLEWGGDGIRCNSVSPGPTLTAMTAGGYADPERRRQREAGIPLGKLGTAEEVANAVVFLLSDLASQITGIDLLVDGGLSNALMVATGTGTGQTR